MEFFYEAIVMAYLTRNKKAFVCPQFSIEDGTNADWRCPDFVALDFEKARVIVAEVSTGSDLGRIAKKADQIYKHSIPKIKMQLARIKSIPDLAGWNVRMQMSIREDLTGDLEKRIKKLGFEADVISLEHTFRRWKPEWTIEQR